MEKGIARIGSGLGADLSRRADRAVLGSRFAAFLGYWEMAPS
jgi:hypothetical protein